MVRPVDAFTHNELLGRGVNVIGYDPLWKARGSARMQSRHFRLIREAGFRHVRVNLHPFQFMGPAPEYRLPESWFATLEWAVEQCEKNGLLCIADFHEFARMGEDPALWKPLFLAFWRQAAERMKDAPESVLFEILNEPNSHLTPELWNEMLTEPLTVIRETNPARTVVIGPANWNGFREVEKLELPEGDRHIIATVHYYHPMAFTHQGAPWSAATKDLSGVEWAGLEEETRAIQSDFGLVQAWAKRKNRPVYLGEFGAYDKGGMPSRARYTAAVARQAEKLGWSWCYWQFDSDFIAYDMEKDQWVEPILNALIPR